jgi:hypothetical protein
MCRKLVDYFPRVLRPDVARAGWIEIKPQRIRSGVDRCQSVLEIGNAADFYEGH